MHENAQKTNDTVTGDKPGLLAFPGGAAKPHEVRPKHHESRTSHLWKRHFHHTFTPIHGSVVVICGVWVGFMTSLRLYRAILHSNSRGATLYELIQGYT